MSLVETKVSFATCQPPGQAINFLTLAHPVMSTVKDSCVLGAFEGGVMQHTEKTRRQEMSFTFHLLDRHVLHTPELQN